MGWLPNISLQSVFRHDVRRRCWTLEVKLVCLAEQLRQTKNAKSERFQQLFDHEVALDGCSTRIMHGSRHLLYQTNGIHKAAALSNVRCHTAAQARSRHKIPNLQPMGNNQIYVQKHTSNFTERPQQTQMCSVKVELTVVCRINDDRCPHAKPILFFVLPVAFLDQFHRS